MPPGSRLLSSLSPPGAPERAAGKEERQKGREGGRAARPDANCPRQPRPLRRLCRRLRPQTGTGAGPRRLLAPAARPDSGQRGRGNRAGPHGACAVGRGRAPAAGEHAQWPAGGRGRAPAPCSAGLRWRRCPARVRRTGRSVIRKFVGGFFFSLFLGSRCGTCLGNLCPGAAGPVCAARAALAEAPQRVPPRSGRASGRGEQPARPPRLPQRRKRVGPPQSPAPPSPGASRPGPGRPEGGWRLHTSESGLGTCELTFWV